MENIQVPLLPTVPPRRYLLTLEALAYLVSHSSRGIEQGQGIGALYTVRMPFDDQMI